MNNSKTFVGSQVDGEKDTISLDNRAWTGSGVDFNLLGLTFELGQAVIYHEGDVPILGLVDGKTRHFTV